MFQPERNPKGQPYERKHSGKRVAIVDVRPLSHSVPASQVGGSSLVKVLLIRKVFRPYDRETHVSDC